MDEVLQLIRELRTSDPEARRSAVIRLGQLGDPRALAALAAELSKRDSQPFRAQIEVGIRDLIITASRAPLVSHDSTAVQALIAVLPDDRRRDWPTAHCKAVLQALPVVWTPSMLVYAVRPNGTVLELDLDSVSHATEEVTDPLARFAITLHGATRYLELVDLIPPPPPNARPCQACAATGYRPWGEPPETTVFQCGSCQGGFGWVLA